MLVMAAVNGFFSGRGQTWTVLGIEAFGTAVNVALALVLIFGRLGFPEMGIDGAGWATVAGSWASAIFGVWCYSSRRKYREQFDTLGRLGARTRAVRPADEVRRAGRDAGVPRRAGVPRVHAARRPARRGALGATTLTVRLNMVAFLPMMGLGQAVCILVGQRLGANRPDLAEKHDLHRPEVGIRLHVHRGRGLCCDPGRAGLHLRGGRDPEKFAAIAAMVPPLLACAAVYSLADAVNVSFAFALRGAGDTRFVTA